MQNSTAWIQPNWRLHPGALQFSNHTVWIAVQSWNRTDSGWIKKWFIQNIWKFTKIYNFLQLKGMKVGIMFSPLRLWMVVLLISMQWATRMIRYNCALGKDDQQNVPESDVKPRWRHFHHSVCRMCMEVIVTNSSIRMSWTVEVNGSAKVPISTSEIVYRKLVLN